MNEKDLTSGVLVCPFCGESGFDAIGLKSHLFRWCHVFDEVESPEEEQERKAWKKSV